MDSKDLKSLFNAIMHSVFNPDILWCGGCGGLKNGKTNIDEIPILKRYQQIYDNLFSEYAEVDIFNLDQINLLFNQIDKITLDFLNEDLREGTKEYIKKRILSYKKFIYKKIKNNDLNISLK